VADSMEATSAQPVPSVSPDVTVSAKNEQ
jgi:hypothetical protein